LGVDVKATSFIIPFLVLAASLFGAEEPLPAIEGDIRNIREPTTPFLFGAVLNGLSIGVWNESTEYHLNHRINVWTSLRTATPNPTGHSLMSDDPLFKDSFLFVTVPDGSISKVALGGPIDGVPGHGFRGGVSDHLHSIIRKPGTYQVQWKIGRLESRVVSFTIIPE
jgi:hypothetical protein